MTFKNDCKNEMVSGGPYTQTLSFFQKRWELDFASSQVVAWGLSLYKVSQNITRIGQRQGTDLQSLMLSRCALSLLLFTAGWVHLLRPELFDPAIPFAAKGLINALSGGLEIALAVGFWVPPLRDASARLSALWFLLLTPVHVYVSVNEIPLFGVGHPALLWARTLLQPGLFFWALSLQDRGWIISQRWSDVLFINYEVEREALERLVPYPLDLYEGKAVVSIVPFVMGNIRFPFLPPVPGFSKLSELNLRTYVRINGKPAVYFLTLDTNHWTAVPVARFGFSLPYRLRSMGLSSAETYEFKSKALVVRARVCETGQGTAFDRWVTERYALVTKSWGSDLWGVVEHMPWELYPAEVLEIRDEFSGEFLKLGNFLSASWARPIDVRFRPFRKIKFKD